MFSFVAQPLAVTLRGWTFRTLRFSVSSDTAIWPRQFCISPLAAGRGHPLIWFILLVTLCALSTAKIVTFPDQLPLYLWPFGNGAMCCIIMAGVVASSIFLKPDGRLPPNKAIRLALGFSIITLIAGRVLDSARHFEDSRNANLVALQHRRQRSSLHAALLDMRLEALAALGGDRSSCGIEHSFDLSLA